MRSQASPGTGVPARPLVGLLRYMANDQPQSTVSLLLWIAQSSYVETHASNHARIVNLYPTFMAKTGQRACYAVPSAYKRYPLSSGLHGQHFHYQRCEC